MEDRERAEDYAKTAKRRGAKSARIYARTIKAGGAQREFFVVVVGEKADDGHDWQPAGTYVEGHDITDDQGPLVHGVNIYKREHCPACNTLRRVFLRWEARDA